MRTTRQKIKLVLFIIAIGITGPLLGYALNQMTGNEPTQQSTYPIGTWNVETERYNCQYGKDACLLEINYTVKDLTTQKSYTLNQKHMEISNLVRLTGNFVFVSENDGTFMLIPSEDSMVYFFVNKTYDFLDPLNTVKENKILNNDYVFGDSIGIGVQGWMFGINLTKSDPTDWTVVTPSPSEKAIGAKIKFSIPVTIAIRSVNMTNTEFYAVKKTSEIPTDNPNMTLTEATNCNASGPCNTSSALTEGTEMQLLWAKIQDQNKQIIENQNIMMCLEVVKDPNNWIAIGKYLTERGVNCTGLDIKGLQ